MKLAWVQTNVVIVGMVECCHAQPPHLVDLGVDLMLGENCDKFCL